MVSILCVGDDLRLLETRVAVLSRTEAAIQWATSENAPAMIESNNYDMVVLCHSLKSDIAHALYNTAHARNAKSLVLRLAPLWSGRGDEDQFRKGSDAVVGVEPGQLVRVASKLLREQVLSTQPL